MRNKGDRFFTSVKKKIKISLFRNKILQADFSIEQKIKNIIKYDKSNYCFLFVVSLFVGLFILSLNCAHQISPDGGPVDMVPPKIISTIPEQGSLNIKTNLFHFEFSEYIDRRSFEEAVFISPAGTKSPEYDWSGKEVDVILPYELKENKTYTITVGIDVFDLNNRNKMAEPFTLAVSTGNKIDSGFIYGKIYDDEPFGLLVSAYKLDSIKSDTLNPSKTLPDYTTQTNKEGEFSLKFLSKGKYRIYAIKDEYKNLIYDPDVDKIGMFYDDVVLGNSKDIMQGLKAQISLFDTVTPKIFSVSAPDENHILLKLSKNIDKSSIGDSSFQVIDSITSVRLKIISFRSDYVKPFSYILQTENQKKTRYLLKSFGIRDSSGNAMDTNYTKIYFDGSIDRDTVRPRIIYSSLIDSSTEYDISEKIIIKFNDNIDTAIFNESIKLADSNKIYSQVKSFWQNLSENHIEFPGLQYNAWYKLKIDSMVNYKNIKNDKQVIYNFKTFDKSKLSSITGKLETKESKYNYYIEALNIDTKKKYRRKTERNNFSFENVLEGKYKFYSFQDADSNEVYSFGKPFPFIRPEKFKYHKDTIKVRAKWPAEMILKFDD